MRRPGFLRGRGAPTDEFDDEEPSFVDGEYDDGFDEGTGDDSDGGTDGADDRVVELFDAEADMADGTGAAHDDRSPRHRLLFATVGAVVVAAAVAAVVLLTPALHVRQVDVVGATHTGDAEVLRMAGAVDDKTLLEVNARSVRSSVRTLPWVDDVAVVRSFPWTLRLEVTERIPAAIVETPAARAVLDDEGMVLENLPPEAAVAGLAKVVGTTPLPAPGSVWADENGTRALAALQGLPVAFVSIVDRVEIGTAGELQMATTDGTIVRFGLPDAVDRKGAVALQLVRDLQRRNVKAETIDVSAPLAPAYKAAPPPKPDPPARKPKGRPT